MTCMGMSPSRGNLGNAVRCVSAYRCWRRCRGRSEARSPTGAEPRATYLYSVDPKDLDHDAVRRIGGRALERWAHSTRRLESHSWVRVTTISDRHRLPAAPLRRQPPKKLCSRG